MRKISCVRLRQMGDVVYIELDDDKHLSYGEKVVVSIAGNDYIGTVLLPTKEIDDNKEIEINGEFVRIACAEDLKRYNENLEEEKEGMKICQELVEKNELIMKLVDFEYSLDKKKILINFTADDRVDFRNLVKDIASTFKARIELRQIGVRDEAKILGGIGCCGRALCCSTYLRDFAPTSIKMAKNQNLSLNPTKISGVCGRLMCCLNNEEETYTFLNKVMPYVGQAVTTKEGYSGEVQSINVLRQTARVIVKLPGDEKEMREYKASDLKFKPNSGEQSADEKNEQ